MMLMSARNICCLLAVWSLLAFQTTVLAAADDRMLVEVSAEKQHVEVNWMHINIKRASAMALPQLWNRIIPQSAQSLLPRRIKAMRFLEKATPTETGVSILFHRKRVLSYLEAQHIPYIAEPPSLNLNIQLYDAAGRRMNQTAADLTDYAGEMAAFWGYHLTPQGAPLVLLWRWMDHRQVSLNVRRGNAGEPESYDVRHISGGDPLASLKPWLSDVLLKTRDLHATSAVVVNTLAEPVVPVVPVQAGMPMQAAFASGLLLTIQREASLPEQVLFEDDLRHNPHVRSLLLKRVNRASQQYRLWLKNGDSQWLIQWFRQRGMSLSATAEGWVAVGG